MKVEAAGFSGPLDLLLSLIERRQIDICEVSIAQIADDYLERVLSLDWLDINEAAEFLVVAASLLYIKVRALLPAAGQQPDEACDDEGEAEGGEDDPAQALVARLIEYRRFRDAARALRPLEAMGLRAYRRLERALPKPGPTFMPPAGLTLQALASAYLQAMSSLPQEFEQAPTDEIPIAQQMVAILSGLARRGKLRLQDLFGTAASRGTVVASLLALLELTRRGRVNAEQPVPFGDIWVRAPESRRWEVGDADVEPEVSTGGN